MKILLLTSHLNIGGIGIYTVTLANCLYKRGHNVYVASSGGILEEELLSDVKNIRVPLSTKSEASPKVWSTVLKLRKFIGDENIDIVHAQTRVAQVAAHLASKMTGVAYVATWHGFYRPRFFRKFFPCWGKKTIAISKTVYRHLIDVFGRDEKSVRLIFNGVDTSKFFNGYSSAECDEIKRRLGLKEGPVIGIISRLAPEKGHIYLIEAFKGLLVEHPEAQLVIVGEGRLESKLKDRALKLGIVCAVHFFGNTLNTKEFLGIMDVFTRPSIEEGFGLGVVEAMLMGIPIVSTGVGGFKSILDYGNVGILVPPKDAASLKDAISRLLRDRAAAKEIGQAGREYALKNFSAERMAAEVIEVYKEVLDEKD